MTNHEERPRSVALVLGAGGARGLAHIGVIEELVARGYRLAAIAGSSMGALVGGIHAAGRLREYREWACALDRSDVIRLLDFAFGHPGLIKGDRVIAAMQDLVGDHRIEDLPLPYVAVATDLSSQREVWLARGRLFDAIRASIAIPMMFTPHRLDGRDLVDGGLLAPVPIAATRLFSADLVIAVDANAQSTMNPRIPQASQAAPGERGADSLSARVHAWFDRLLEGKSNAATQPGLLDLMSRALDTIHARMSQMQLALDPPDVLIRIPHDACYFYEFWRAHELIDIGREATRRALDDFERTPAARPRPGRPRRSGSRERLPAWAWTRCARCSR